MEQDQDFGMVELLEHDKIKLVSLDEQWNKFRDGLEDANQKSYAQLKTEMDHTSDDFKKEV